ncbi:MAG: hypothetical protein ACP5D2_04190 [Candidatus Nanoarchaeia archaeon]
MDTQTWINIALVIFAIWNGIDLFRLKRQINITDEEKLQEMYKDDEEEY